MGGDLRMDGAKHVNAYDMTDMPNFIGGMNIRFV